MKTRAANGSAASDSHASEIDAGERERLAKILDEYLVGLERGEAIEPAELLARHPDMADRLRGYLSGLALFQRELDPPASPLPVLGGAANGTILGDFRLLREIGRGGMGIVYEAVQMSLGRRVAVKLLPLSASVNEKQIARFKHEAQAAAQIDHPHIVPVFAIGQEHITHYFAMQLITGQSLAEMVAELRDEAAVTNAAETLDHVAAVARMGVQAAEALDAAHEIGVVHRDIKPSNLLLDEKGKVWVTDFGVARCKSSDALTETGYVVGSMPYMSPEQALGQSALVDHRTDIYSLGITLYELATLRHPCEGAAHAETAIEHTRAQWQRPRAWNSAIPTDFEVIILKAMSEDRDERYATARELADDLKLFLEGKPILARPLPLSARIEKWARRHRKTVVASLISLSLALVGVVFSLVMIAGERAEKGAALQAARQSNQESEKNFRRAEANFRQTREMLDTFGAQVNEMLANDVPGSEGIRRKLLAKMLPYYRDFAREAANDPSLQADLALTYSKIGNLSEQIGSLEEAEQAYRDAQSIYERLVKSRPRDLQHLRSLALCDNNLGEVLQKRGDLYSAEKQLQRAAAAQTKLVTNATLAGEVRPELATAQVNLGLLFSQKNDKVRAVEHYQVAIQIQESIRKVDPDNEANLNSLAGTYNNLSSLYLPAQPAVAKEWVERAIGLQVALIKAQPGRRNYQSELAVSFNNLGAIHGRMSNWRDAETCFRDAITIQERLTTISPLNNNYQRDLAASFNNLGMTQASAKSFVAAEKSYQAALEIQLELLTALPGDPNICSSLGGIYNNLGIIQLQNEQWEPAEKSFAAAIAQQKIAFARAPAVSRYRESLSKHYYNQATVLRHLDRPAEAAAVTIARRELWPRDQARLQRLAEDLAAICNELPAGEVRQRYQTEVAQTRARASKSKRDASPAGGPRQYSVSSECDEQSIDLEIK
ncbi:serine/threonine-protein kinase [Anatilimnocola floriformis]|uniref:serine/threonine-protein kinase n=1 Tax=Anatilimnocola floriformis TaxID=2948575 RepID=UPI0020C4A237|nr:serine/threonine-protein kinase [Anatilimnocola floriformis]